jgi:hypothetical protein
MRVCVCGVATNFDSHAINNLGQQGAGVWAIMRASAAHLRQLGQSRRSHGISRENKGEYSWALAS